eukprot:2925639-Pyramimonas_sp.AAC.1
MSADGRLAAPPPAQAARVEAALAGDDHVCGADEVSTADYARLGFTVEVPGRDRDGFATLAR